MNSNELVGRFFDWDIVIIT